MMAEFMTPPQHINFSAKKLFDHMGELLDGSIAYLGKQGGGPQEQHTHAHNHLFVVVKGEAKVKLEQEEILIKENESFYVKGAMPHSIWNHWDGTTIMLNLSIKA